MTAKCELELAGLPASRDDAPTSASSCARLIEPVRRASDAGVGRRSAAAPGSRRFREGALRLGGRHRTGPAALLPRARAHPAHRIRRHAERRQPHPHGVSRPAAATLVAMHCARTIEHRTHRQRGWRGTRAIVRLAHRSRSTHMGKKNIAVATVAAPLIDIGIKGKDREKIVAGLSTRAGRHLHPVSEDAQLPLERGRPDVQHAAPHVHGRSTPSCGTPLDLIAERIRALGFPGAGDLQGVRQADVHR